jgi:hypothetical protein
VYVGVFGTPPIVADGLGGARVNGGAAHMQDRLERKLPVLCVYDSYDPNLITGGTLANAIIHKNDVLNEPRWKIARWLRRLAAKL